MPSDHAYLVTLKYTKLAGNVTRPAAENPHTDVEFDVVVGKYPSSSIAKRVQASRHAPLPFAGLSA